jgi:hypothetical protein
MTIFCSIALAPKCLWRAAAANQVAANDANASVPVRIH